MYTDKTVGYLAPEIEVSNVVVEQGISTSPNMEQIGGENPEIDW